MPPGLILWILINVVILSIVVFAFARHDAQFVWGKYLLLLAVLALLQGFVIPYILPWVPGNLIIGIAFSQLTLAFLLTLFISALLALEWPKALICTVATIILTNAVSIGSQVIFGLEKSKAYQAVVDKSLDEDDYVTLIFGHQPLSSKLDLGPVSRAILTDWNQRITFELDTALTMPASKQEETMKRFQSILNNYGKRTREMLSKAELSRFHSEFVKSRFLPVEPIVRSATQFDLRFTDVGESKLELFDSENRSAFSSLAVMKHIKSKPTAMNALKHPERAAWYHGMKWLAENAKQVPAGGSSEITQLINQKLKTSPSDREAQEQGALALAGWGDESVSSALDAALETGSVEKTFLALTQREPAHAARMILLYGRDKEFAEKALRGVTQNTPATAEPVLSAIAPHHVDSAEYQGIVRRYIARTKLAIPRATVIPNAPNFEKDHRLNFLRDAAMGTDPAAWAPAMHRLMVLDSRLARELFENREDDAFRIVVSSAWADRTTFSEKDVLPLLLQNDFEVLRHAHYLLMELAGDHTIAELDQCANRTKGAFSSSESALLSRLRDGIRYRIPGLIGRDQALVAAKKQAEEDLVLLKEKEAESIEEHIRRIGDPDLRATEVSRDMIKLMQKDMETPGLVPNIMDELTLELNQIRFSSTVVKSSRLTYYRALLQFARANEPADHKFMQELALQHKDWPVVMASWVKRDPAGVTKALLKRPTDEKLWDMTLRTWTKEAEVDEHALADLLTVNNPKLTTKVVALLEAKPPKGESLPKLNAFVKTKPTHLTDSQWNTIRPTLEKIIKASVNKQWADFESQYEEGSPSRKVAEAISVYEKARGSVSEPSSELGLITVIANNRWSADATLKVQDYLDRFLKSDHLSSKIGLAELYLKWRQHDQIEFFRQLAEVSSTEKDHNRAWLAGIAGLFRGDDLEMTREVITEMAAEKGWSLEMVRALRVYEITPPEKEILPLLKVPNYAVLRTAVALCAEFGGTECAYALPKVVGFHRSILSTQESQKLDLAARKAAEVCRKRGAGG